MRKPPPLANVKHADEYTTEDLNADVEEFQLAFVRYLRAIRGTEEREDDGGNGLINLSERNGKLRDR